MAQEVDLRTALNTEIEALLAGLPGVAAVLLRDLDPSSGSDPAGQEVAICPDVRMPAASLIKLPLAWHFFRECTLGRIDPDEQVPLPPEAMTPGFGVLRSLAPGLHLRLRDLAALAILVSDNTATNLLIDRLGIDPVNRTIGDLGMAQTVLMRKMYDYRDPAKNNFTTARDIATFYSVLLRGDGLAPAWRDEFLRCLLGQQCRNKLPSGLPREAVLAHKTGDQAQVEHDAGIFFSPASALPDRRLIAVVMTMDLAHNVDGVLLCRRVGELAWQWVSR